MNNLELIDFHKRVQNEVNRLDKRLKVTASLSFDGEYLYSFYVHNMSSVYKDYPEEKEISKCISTCESNRNPEFILLMLATAINYLLSPKKEVSDGE